MAEAAADKLMTKADAKTCVTLLRWSADWDTACSLYEQAAAEFRRLGNKRKARLALEKAAYAQERLNSPWHAARHMEAAAGVCKDGGGAAAEVAACFRQAAELYKQAGRGQTAADCLCRGGKAVEAMEVGVACALYMEAVTVYEEEDKQLYSQDAFRQAVVLQLRTAQWADAAATMLRFAVACDANGATQSQRRCYLGALVVQLHAHDAEQAAGCLRDCTAVPAFHGSDECLAAVDLLDAYRTGDAEAIRRTVKDHSSVFSGLDISVSRLAVKLPSGDDSTLAAMAAALGGGAAAGVAVVSLDSVLQSGKMGMASAAAHVSMHDLDESDLC